MGDTYKNSLSVRPGNIKRNQLKYTSSNRSVAAVSSDGAITANGPGRAVIKAIGVDGSGKSSSYVVEVNTISAAQTLVAMYIGETYASVLNGAVYGSEVSDIVWTSSDPSVVKVDNTGELTAIGLGTATITASVGNAAAQSTGFKVTVSYWIRKDSTHFIAHRGLSSKAPENTLRAFILAGEAGFWGTETDVHKTKDGHFVLQHDDTLFRMCGYSRKVEDMTLEEIKSVRITKGNYYETYRSDELATTIPTLEEYLKICIQYNMVPVIEIKMKYDRNGTAKEPGEESAGSFDSEEEDRRALFGLVDSIMGNRPYVFIDFDAVTLEKLKGIIPEEKLAHVTFQCLSEMYTGEMQGICTANSFDYSFNHLKVSLDLVKSLRERGTRVGLWSVNAKKKVEEMLVNGIDYITTDSLFW